MKAILRAESLLADVICAGVGKYQVELELQREALLKVIDR